MHATPTRKQLGDGEAKQRRVAYGSDVIKDELRKGTGGPQGAGPEQVGDSSEDEDEEASAVVGKRESITRCAAGLPLQNITATAFEFTRATGRALFDSLGRKVQ